MNMEFVIGNHKSRIGNPGNQYIIKLRITQSRLIKLYYTSHNWSTLKYVVDLLLWFLFYILLSSDAEKSKLYISLKSTRMACCILYGYATYDKFGSEIYC